MTGSETNDVMTVGGLAVAVAIFYAAWHEYSAKNRRDAQLLAALGAVSFVGSIAVWIH
jgi:hypothetical protein